MYTIKSFLNYRKKCPFCESDLTLNVWNVPPADMKATIYSDGIAFKTSFDINELDSAIKEEDYKHGFMLSSNNRISYLDKESEEKIKQYFATETLNLDMICSDCYNFSYYSKFILDYANNYHPDIFSNISCNNNIKHSIEAELFIITDYEAKGFEEVTYTFTNDFARGFGELSIRYDDDIEAENSYSVPIIPFDKFNFKNHDSVIDRIRKIAILL